MSAAIVDMLAAVLPDMRVAMASDRSGWWLRTAAAAPLIRVTRASGDACLWHGERPMEVARDLDAAAALIDRIETVTGWRFEPVDCARADPATAIAIADDQGGVTVELGLDADIVPPPTFVRNAGSALPDRAVARTLVLTGPPLSVDDAATIAPDDWILLSEPMPARIAGTDETPATYDITTGTLRKAADVDGNAGFAVTAALRIEGVAIAEQDIARLATGEAIAVGVLPVGTAAALVIGDVVVGRGVLDRMGSHPALRVVAVDQGGDTD